jgi:rSAM/selenodomain-associated transferase 1
MPWAPIPGAWRGAMTSNARADHGTRIAIFARAPVPGEAKTRLIALLGAEGAALLHAQLLVHAIRTAIASDLGPVELWCAPDCDHPFFVQCAQDLGVSLRTQQGADLGRRMACAFAAALCENAPLVVIGSDCPALTPEKLREAAQALQTYEVVVAPAEDGGYVLIGLSAPDPGLFEDMAWGSALVMSETRARLARAGTRWKELETLWDIDRPEDYARLEREGWLSG